MADESKNAITIFGKLDAPQTGQSDPLTIDLTAIETKIEPPKAEAIGPDADAAAPGSQADGFRWDKFAPLAASLAAALLVGAFAGGAATYELARQAMPVLPASAISEETQALQDKVAKLSGELATFKSGVETANRAASQQLAKIGERIERAEKAQAEPAAKLGKISESLDRLERRSAAAQAPAADITGSVTSVEKQQGKPVVLEGWKLRDYYAGRALLESRSGTLFEVSPGSNLPGIGKIETIKRVDGKVVVTTPKGTIAAVLDPPRRPYLPQGY